MADDMEKNKNKEQGGKSEQPSNQPGQFDQNRQTGQGGQQSGQGGQQSGQPGQPKKGQNRDQNEEDNENLDRQRRAS